MKRAWIVGVVLVMGLVLVSATSWAALSVEVKYTETAVGDGTWNYGYTFYNNTSPSDGLSLWDVQLNFGQSGSSLLSATEPSGSNWFLFDSYKPAGEAGYVHFTSDGSNDVFAGYSLGLFNVSFSERLTGSPTFEASLWNSATGESLPGVTGAASPVPIPSAALLLGSGLAGLGFIGSRKKR